MEEGSPSCLSPIDLEGSLVYDRTRVFGLNCIMHSFRFSLMAALLFGPTIAAAAPQETAPLPVYDAYLKQCLLSASKKAQSDSHLAGAGLVCQCSYERLEGQARITRPQLSQALSVCSKELVANPQAFMGEYADRLRKGLRRAREL